MIIKSIRLNNIRSYTSCYLDFPSCSTLLSGNIGSGKSTILLAIEFALFGLSTSLTGDSLLRNGEDNGFVELNFEVDNKKVIIKRVLKRGHDSITQGNGHIEINNEIKKLSPLELKQAVIELINYPRELLTKSKSLIYKYTVYTPQEEIKHILTGDDEIRLDILRKVFGIDKYKRVKENSSIILNKIRERKNSFLGIVIDLEERKSELAKEEEKQSMIVSRLEEIKQKLALSNKEVEIKKSEINEIEASSIRLKELNNKLAINEIQIQNSTDKKKRTEEEIIKKELQINELGDIVFLNLDATKALKKAKEIESIEVELRTLNGRLSQLKEKERNSLEIKKSIESLDICPLCRQNVSSEHKATIVNTENKKIEEAFDEVVSITAKKAEKESQLIIVKKELENIKAEEKDAELNNLRFKALEEKKKTKEELLNNKLVNIKEIDALNIERNKLLEEKGRFDPDIEDSYIRNKKDLERLIIKQREFEIARNSYEVELRLLHQKKETLINEISKKESAKKEIQKLSSIEYWLDSSFVNLVETIEKQVMLRIYADFNGLFQKWFSMLIDNENLIARLNENFSPLIEQNGHDIAYDYLSGGEKTACALAYRLALNQVINNLMSNIKTNDLLILDEPTDGFSDEQLDRMRDVLQDLKIKQIIIVSHEAKVEGFVDHIIRLQKKNHESLIVT
ncbi:hypothetical protein HYX19_04310 [Candidatus Woesearchaeota archaeon]|nr:hypothetical protein [Candidatus Woesearchaeota archaeon]